MLDLRLRGDDEPNGIFVINEKLEFRKAGTTLRCCKNVTKIVKFLLQIREFIFFEAEYASNSHSREFLVSPAIDAGASKLLNMYLLRRYIRCKRN